MQNEKLDKKTINEIVKKLQKLKPGFLPFDIFIEFCRLSVTPIVDIVPFREAGNSIEVLLTKRDDNDLFWPGMWHVPGCVILSSDKEKSLECAFDRILQRELDGISIISIRISLVTHFRRV